MTLTAFIKNKEKFTKSLKEENFTIIGHMNGAGEVLSRLCRIGRAAIGQSSILGVVKNEVLHAQAGRQSTRIERGAVVFFRHCVKKVAE